MPQYQGVWTLQQQMQALTSGQWATDPLFDYTTLLLQGDAGANGAQNNVFYDTSPNQFAITRNGNTTQGSFSPFSLQPGAWANFFGSGANLTTPGNAVFNLPGDFTIEGWVFLNSYVGGSFNELMIWECRSGTSTGSNFGIDNAASANPGRLFIWTGGANIAATSAGAVPLNTWTHVAAVRSGTGSNNVKLYINGILAAQGTNTTTLGDSTTTNYIGNSSYAQAFNNYLSNFRITKGGALYTGNFTPSAAPLTTTVSAGTVSLLTCQSNRFVDNSANALALTANSSPSVQAFSPFAPQYQWTSDVIGGSGYFDGTGDYLQLASPTSAVAMGSGDFTFSAWIYPTAFTSPVAGILDIANGSNATRFSVILYSNGKIYVDNNTNLLISANAVPLNAWTYVSVVRSGSTMTIYYNGVSQASGTVTQNFTDTTTYIGRSFDGYYFQGYIAGMRLVKGSALSATTPTAPLTAVTNTQLLLNFTNAGIYDGTMKNNLETVGGASVSTSIVKYGSGSMYFDGSGDTLSAPSSVNFQMGSGDFTIESWVNFSSVSGEKGIASYFAAGTPNAGFTLRLSTSNSPSGLRFVASGASDVVLQAAWTPSTNTWYHVAVVRLNNTLTAYVNGVSIGSTSITITIGVPSAAFVVGTAQTVASSDMNGYLDDFRITKGIARYTQNFIPPSVALPRQ